MKENSLKVKINNELFVGDHVHLMDIDETATVTWIEDNMIVGRLDHACPQGQYFSTGIENVQLICKQ